MRRRVLGSLVLVGLVLIAGLQGQDYYKSVSATPTFTAVTVGTNPPATQGAVRMGVGDYITWLCTTGSCSNPTTMGFTIDGNGNPQFPVLSGNNAYEFVPGADNNNNLGSNAQGRYWKTGYFKTSLVVPLVQSTTAKLLLQGTGTGPTQVATTQTTVPTCTASCGTSPSVTGSDTAMTVTMGATGTPATPFTVTFNGTWAAEPACVASLDTAGITKYVTATVTTTTTVAVNTAIAPGNSDKFHILCMGEQ